MWNIYFIYYTKILSDIYIYIKFQITYTLYLISIYFIGA